MTEKPWLPNCCEACVGWKRKDEYTGTCTKGDSLNAGGTTDSRYRCPSFERKEGI